MKNLALFIVSVIIGAVIVMQYKNKPSIVHSTKPDTFSFSLDAAPPASLKGNITDMHGDVLWQSRTATEASVIAAPQIIQQGEDLTASASGDSVTVVFPNAAHISLNPGDLYFAQTLPAGIVLQQTSGSVSYQKLGTIPLSVRALHALIDIHGISVVQIDGSTFTIIGSGSATVAFNNLQNVSQVVNIPGDYVYFFNDQTRRGKLVKMSER